MYVNALARVEQNEAIEESFTCNLQCLCISCSWLVDLSRCQAHVHAPLYGTITASQLIQGKQTTIKTVSNCAPTLFSWSLVHLWDFKTHHLMWLAVRGQDKTMSFIVFLLTLCQYLNAITVTLWIINYNPLLHGSIFQNTFLKSALLFALLCWKCFWTIHQNPGCVLDLQYIPPQGSHSHIARTTVCVSAGERYG